LTAEAKIEDNYSTSLHRRSTSLSANVDETLTGPVTSGC
jgi:hypothetical protein